MPNGTLSDVADAQRAASLTTDPPWRRVPFGAAWAALVAGTLPTLFGTRPAERTTAVINGIVIVAFFVMAFAFLTIQRRRGVGVASWRSGNVLAVRGAVVAVFALLGAPARLVHAWWIPQGGLQSYAFLFVSFFVLWNSYLFVLDKTDATWQNRVVLSATNLGRFNDFIAPRPRLLLTAMLAVAPMTLDRLARTLNTSEDDLSHHITELAVIYYVRIQPDAKNPERQWISLSAAGHTVYTGHVQALRGGATLTPVAAGVA